MVAGENEEKKVLLILNFASQSSPMPTTSEAEEHLRVIRSLMERATFYRAISAQGAIVGGGWTLVGAVTLWAIGEMDRFANAPESGKMRLAFVAVWSAVLLVTALANFYFLWRSAKLRKERFFSAGMRQAGISLAPPLICGGVLSFVALWQDWPPSVMPALWMMFYGLALLGTAHFSPRSIVYLGLAFLAGSFISGLFLLNQWGSVMTSGEIYSSFVASLLMTATFGLFHFIYAIFTWPRPFAHLSAEKEAIVSDV